MPRTGTPRSLPPEDRAAARRRSGSNVTLPPETPASAVTDGLFSDSRASNGGATVNDPYVEVDLHGVRDITDIRVSPPPGAAIDLQGYRVYASASPFAVLARLKGRKS